MKSRAGSLPARLFLWAGVLPAGGRVAAARAARHTRAMRPSSPLHRRREDIANAITHGIALLAAVASVPALVVGASRGADAATIVGMSVFATAVVALYLASTLYHAWPHGRTKGVLRVCDHVAIYLLIAGTYTPFALGVLRGAWGWTLFGLIWGLAVAGSVLKISGALRQGRVSTGLYLAMGWLVIIAIEPLYRALPGWGLFWLVAGGLAYTGGVVFFLAEGRLRYSHSVWHLFVIAGTACHSVAVFGYAV